MYFDCKPLQLFFIGKILITYYSIISLPKITYVFLVLFAMFITSKDQKISLVLEVGDVFSLDILLERRDGRFMTWKQGLFL